LSRPYANPLLLDIRLSRYLKFYFLLVFCLLVIALYNIPLWWMLKALLLTMGAMFIGFQFRKYAHDYRLTWADDNQWTVDVNNQQSTAELQASSFISVRLALLNFKDEAGRSFSVPVFSDSINAEQFRQLRVRLRVENPVHKKTC